MAPSKLKRAIGAVKDQTSVGLAKVGAGSASTSDLEVAIVKATRHEEYPAEEKHIREILSLTTYSRHFVSACVSTISRRLNRTKNWTVALKTLILIQRLLADGDQAYEQEFFFATRRGTRLLNMSDFRDVSRSNSWDYSAFVRTYALYLDERLDYRMQGKYGKRYVCCVCDEDDEDATDPATAIIVRSTPVSEMKTEQIFTRAQHVQQLLDRFLACRPTGGARNNRVVIVALYPIMKESFQIYYDITEILGILIDRFMELEILDSVKVYEIFRRVSKQFEELDAFYSWCKHMGIARSSEYPEVEKITQKKLDLMDEFIRDKSALAQTKKAKILDAQLNEGNESTKTKEVQEDMNLMKALPPPEGFTMEPPAEEQGQEEEKEEETEKAETANANANAQQQQEGDLLNLGDTTSVDSGEKLALVLFDGAVENSSAAAAPPAWEAFKDEDTDWETALVQTATSLSGQKPQLAGDMDMMLLDGMYQHGATNAAVMASTAYGASGSASSMAFGSAARPSSTLALPAPPTSNRNSNGGGAPATASVDPFAASLGVAPPPYVQMHDMEKKQRLLAEEQRLWEQYTRDGKQGHMAMMVRPNPEFPYSMGPYSYVPRYW